MTGWTPPEGHSGRWILACVAGLSLGAALGTLWNALLLPAIAPEATRLGMLTALVQATAGAVLGLCLGATQGVVLRRAYPGLPLPAWIGVSAAAGYGVALATTLIYGQLARHAGSIPIPVFIILGATLKGLLGGVFFGQAQGRVLDTVVADRASWARVVLVGWLLGAMLGSLRWLLGLPGGEPALLVAGALVSGAVEGLALGLVTAGAFRFMPPRRAP
jgi:hypothetical protein